MVRIEERLTMQYLVAFLREMPIFRGCPTYSPTISTAPAR